MNYLTLWQTALFTYKNVNPIQTLTFVRSALLSISQMHFFTMKGIPSVLLPDTWAKSLPKSCRRPWSFLWPHWMAMVSRHLLWQAR